MHRCPNCDEDMEELDSLPEEKTIWFECWCCGYTEERNKSRQALKNLDEIYNEGDDDVPI